MKITTPSSITPHANAVLPVCVPILVRHKMSGEESTAIILQDEVLFAYEDGLTHCPLKYFKETFSYIRAYTPGEELNIKM